MHLDTREERQGVGWFRLHLAVPPEMRNRVLSFAVTQVGNTEFYFDGRLIRTLGGFGAEDEATKVNVADVPVLTPVAFDDRPLHVIAVRFSTFDDIGYRFPDHDKHGRGGFDVALGDPDAVMAQRTGFLRERLKHHWVPAATAFTIALLHLLLFAFYPRQIANLYYALFTMSAGMIAYLPTRYLMLTDAADVASWFKWVQISLILCSLTGMRFLYAIFYDRMPKIFWLWVGVGIVFAVAFWDGPPTKTLYFTLITFTEILRVLIVAVVKQKPYAWLIALGVAAFILASAYQILSETITRGGGDDPSYHMYDLLAMLIIMSVGLALRFAKVNKNLAIRLDEVRELSAERLEQERRAKEQEIERMRLEADNELKAKELDEARKRQKVMDELAIANHDLRQTQSQLVQSEKMAALGNLVAGVAHEINTPVGAICSMHDTLVRALGKLKKELGPDEAGNSKVQTVIKVIEDANDVIRSGSDRVTTIVRRLRSFARLDEAEMKRVDIHEGLEDTLTLVHHELKHHVTVHRDYGDLPRVECYPGRLNQVFLNLLVNAKQAIDGDGDITITTSHRDDRVRIEIKDNGRGIPEDHVREIFDPGFTTKGVGVGTGLGLSICYQIILDHKGEIIVKSKVGEGTTFTIVLPINLG
jgi:signal transduction histidine kinase